jgi:hypothetical protein
MAQLDWPRPARQAGQQATTASEFALKLIQLDRSANSQVLK